MKTKTEKNGLLPQLRRNEMRNRLARFASLLVLTALLAAGCNPDPMGTTARSAVPVLTPSSHQELTSFLVDNGYDWDSLDSGVPPFILQALPPDLGELKTIEEKKRLFFLSLLPMVLMINEEIHKQRLELMAIFRYYDSGLPLNPEQWERLFFLAGEYGIRENPLADPLARRTLLRRVDTLPPSLVLAQAANESGYGTSRFAVEGNNLFGLWTYIRGTGLVPLKRPPGRTYEVQRFPTLFDSVRAYMNNLNRHRAYRPMRELRSLLRSRGLELRGIDLAAGLRLYSARREAYVREIRSIIRGNNLSRLSSAALAKPFPPGPPRQFTASTLSVLLAG
jgi:Bax protein